MELSLCNMPQANYPLNTVLLPCRFAKVEGDPKRQKVFTISNPIGASKPPSFLQRWNTKTFTLEQAIPKEGSLSAIAVSDNGTYVATGSMFDGTVEIYTAFNLQVILHYLIPIGLSWHSRLMYGRSYLDVNWWTKRTIQHPGCIFTVLEKGGEVSCYIYYWPWILANVGRGRCDSWI